MEEVSTTSSLSEPHCVDHAFGPDIWAEVGGRPETWREAAALYRRLGVRDLAGAVTAVLGQPIAVRKARRGDMVMVRGSLGICRGEVVDTFGETVRIGEADRAWRYRDVRGGGH